MTSRNTILKNSIDGFLARRGMSRSRFGLKTAGNPSLVARIAAGRVIRLGSADRILAYMGEEPFGPAFRREVEAFIAITRTKASLLGQEAVGDPCFVRRLRQGASPRLDTCDRVSAWMESQSSEAERLAVRAAVEDDVPAVPVDCAKQWEAEMDDDATIHGHARVGGLSGPEPAHAGPLPGERRGSQVSQVRQPGALRPRRCRGVGGGTPLQLDLRRGQLRPEDGVMDGPGWRRIKDKPGSYLRRFAG